MSIALEKITLRRLQWFYLIVKHGSMAAAARELGVHMNTLGREIALLEENIGTPLRSKHKQRLVLTEAGQEVAEYASDVLNRFHSLNLPSIEQNVSELTIAAWHGTCAVYLPEIITRFWKEHPEIKITVQSAPEDFFLTSSICDIIIGSNMKNKHELSQTFLKEYEYFLYASQEYLDQYGHPSSMSNLSGHRLLVYDTSEAQYINDLDLSCSVIETNSYRTLVELGRQHQGIFPLTRDLEMEYRASGERFIRLFDKPCEIEKDYFMYSRHSPKLMMIQKFKTITEQVIS